VLSSVTDTEGVNSRISRSGRRLDALLSLPRRLRLLRFKGGPAAARGTSAGTLRLLQLTDTHLYGNPDGRLLGQNTRRTLELVLEHALATAWPVDRVLLTGDLVHDESREGYRYLAERLGRLGVPCNGLPGNHDAPRVMAGTLDGGVVSAARSVRCGAWNLVFLDSTVPGAEGGHLADAELRGLETALGAHPEAHALVCLHHQPVPVGSAWIDTMALDNPGELFGVIDAHPQVRGILWGHVHQDYNGWRGRVRLLGTPSTCVQFLPGSDVFALDERPPGYRWLELSPDGRIETGVERIAAYPDPLRLQTHGY
jgi:Icc protein